MTKSAERTVYESERRVRDRRRGHLLLIAVVVVLAGVAAAGAVLLLGGRGARAEADGGTAAAAPAAAASPSPVSVAAVTLGGVKVHRGETARLRYRIDDPLGRTWAAKLRVLDESGAAVKTQGLGGAVTAGSVHTASFRVRLPVGAYSYVVHVQDAEATVEATSTASRLTVLKALPPAFPGARAVAAALDWVSRSRLRDRGSRGRQPRRAARPARTRALHRRQPRQGHAAGGVPAQGAAPGEPRRGRDADDRGVGQRRRLRRAGRRRDVGHQEGREARRHAGLQGRRVLDRLPAVGRRPGALLLRLPAATCRPHGARSRASC